MNAAQITSILELAANITLTAIPATAAIAPLVAGLEAGLNPLISSIANGSTTTTDIMAGYGALIGVITTLKAQTGIAPDVLSKLDEYTIAAQNGTASALAVAVNGYDPTQLAPVTPIA